jgi:hypothetical protein
MEKTKKHLKNYLVAAALLAAACGCGPSTGVNETEIAVVFTGETHGMLHPCDCPLDPGGGLAQRAYFLKKIEAQKRLLIDGGAFAAGSIHDNYSMGRSHDSLRTLQTISAMGLMGYDAVAVGDDDLQYGGEWLAARAKEANLPLVSANSFSKNGEYLTAPYILVSRGDFTFGITSVLTEEKLFPADTNVIIKPPLESLMKIWQELEEKSDHQILLSHLGEDETVNLLTHFPGLFLAANGHKKVSSEPLLGVDGTPMLNFGFQGRSMAYAVYGLRDHSYELKKSGWHMIHEGMSADSAVSVMLADTPPQVERAEKVRNYDLYVMSLCPYGVRGLKDLVEVANAFPQREWNVWFIGSVNGGRLSSLRGDEEIFDEMLWLGVKALYPARYLEFLSIIAASPPASSSAATLNVIKRMGLDVNKIRLWVDEFGKNELSRHYQRSARLNVRSSPTFMINNNPYKKALGSGKAVRDECRIEEFKPSVCASLPECIDDSDCAQKGKLGRCIKDTKTGSASCEFRDDAAFKLTVLIADSAWDNPQNVMINRVEETLPGAQIEIVRVSTDAGKRIMEKHARPDLPFFFFEKAAANAFRFSSMSNLLKETEDGFILKDDAVKKNYFPNREEKRGSFALYIDPLMSDAGKIINSVMSNPALEKRITFRPSLLKDPGAGGLNNEDRMRFEEAHRWLVLEAHFPLNYPGYLKAYSENPATSYWFRWLDKVGINQRMFTNRVDAASTMLAGYWKDFSQISANEPVMLMVDNRVKVTVSSLKDLERILKIIEDK